MEMLFEHSTYNISFALVAFDEGFDVYVAHPDDETVLLKSTEEIEDADGHLFVVVKTYKELM